MTMHSSGPQPRGGDVLVVNWENGGNMPPFLGLARRLIERGHRVRLLSDEANRQDAAQVEQLEFAPYSRAPSRPDKSAGSDILRDWQYVFAPRRLNRLVAAIMVGPAGAYADDVLEQIDRRRPDVLVVNEALLGGLIAGESSGVPVVAVSPHTYQYPASGRPPFGVGLAPLGGVVGTSRDRVFDWFATGVYDRHLGRLNAVRSRYGLHRVKHVLDVVRRADRLLVMTSPAFDFVPVPLPHHVRYVGPILDDPIGPNAWVSPWEANDERPLVLVGLSTTFMGQVALLQRIVTALGELPVRGLVTVGPAINPESIATPANVWATSFVPHSQVLPSAAVMVTHGGHGSIMRALAHDVPLVVMPMARDQLDNAVRVAVRGAGLQLKPSAPVPAIRRAVARTLAEPSFHAAAERLGAQIRLDAAKGSAVHEIEAVMIQAHQSEK